MNIRKLPTNLKKIWKNKKQIFQGLYFKIFKYSSYVEEVAAERMNICKKCIKFDKKGTKCMIPGTQPCCGECGCSLSIKLRSMSTECPLKRWEAVMSEELEDKLNK